MAPRPTGGGADQPSATGGGGDEPHDFSEFTDFEFSQRTVFCPLLNAPVQASIRRQNGVYTLEISLIEAGDPATDVCEQGIVATDAPCVTVRDLPARELTAAEVQRVRDAFSNVLIVRGTLPSGECNDPCRIIQAGWDGVRAANDLAGCALSGDRTFNELAPGEVDALVALLNELAAATPPVQGSACEALVARCFRSVELLPGFPAENRIHWVVGFRPDGSYDYQYSDVEEIGTYTCDQGQVLGQFGTGEFQRQRSGSFDSATGILLWQGNQYTADGSARGCYISG
jgi:hypothetical protein